MRTTRAASLAVFLVAITAAVSVGFSPRIDASYVRLEPVAGDPRLELGASMEAGGLGRADADWMSTLMVSTVDTRAVDATYCAHRRAIVWWKDVDAAGPVLRFTRVALAAPCVESFLSIPEFQAEQPPAGQARFFRLHTGEVASGPLPSTREVWVEIGEYFTSSCSGGVPCDVWTDMQSGWGPGSVVTETAVVDPEYGVSIPLGLWQSP